MRAWDIAKTVCGEMLFPSSVKCIVCNRELSENHYLNTCKHCNLALNLISCNKCGSAIDNQAQFCNDCMNSRVQPFYDKIVAPFVYEDDVKKLIQRFKYANARYLREIFVKMMVNTLVKSELEFDIITFVPIHKRRRRARGYNQAQLLATSVFAALDGEDIACLQLIEKAVYTKNLARMSKEQRKKYIAGSFVIDKQIDKSTDISGKRIILVDDVVTSGATADECAKILKQAGADKVYVLAAAVGRKKPLLT